HGIDKRRSSEIAADGQIEIVAEVFRHPPLCRNTSRCLFDAMIDAPDHEWQPLTEMAENHVQLRMTIKQTAGHQSQSVRCRFDAEGPCRSPKPWMTFKNGFAAEERIARMEIQRVIQLFEFCKERFITRVIEIDDIVCIADLRKSIDHRSLEAEILDAPG